jgi:hypothetical protein
MARDSEDLAADLIEAWTATETGLRSLVGGTALTGQMLIRELRQRHFLSLEQANALAEFHAARERAARVDYKPTEGDVNASRDAFLKLEEHAPELKPWEDRLSELGGELDDIDELFIEVDGAVASESGEVEVARGQLELFGTLLSSLADSKTDDGGPAAEPQVDVHAVLTREGRRLSGSWEDIVRSMREAEGEPDGTLREYMIRTAKRTFRETGIRVPSHDAELFVRGSADAGMLRIVR